MLHMIIAVNYQDNITDDDHNFYNDNYLNNNEVHLFLFCWRNKIKGIAC